MIKIVCDTNILISAYVYPGGTTERVLDFVRSGELVLCMSPEIISEFKTVLVRKFRYSPGEADVFAGRVLAIAQMVYPTERLRMVSRVDADNRILECAMAARADYLVTGDQRDLLPLKKIGTCAIITAREFLQVLQGR